ncbi:MAG: tetratricopeptide repeat protein [Myxococcota bacterium]
MSLRSTSAVAFFTLAMLGPASSRGADPPLWDAARVPRLHRDVGALRDAEWLLLQARASPDARTTLLLREAVRILERVDAVSSPDPRVRFFYGRMLGRVGRDALAVKVLREAIAFAPAHPSANEARFSLAVSLARLGRTQEEIRAYEAWLEREPSTKHRSIGLSNLAEGFMASGRIDEAVRGYRQAIDLAHDNALAHWGLAVALDRSGDPAGAIHEAGVALTYDPDAKELNSENVFFVPARERFWYRALGAMARANSTHDVALRALWWDRAALLWRQYIDAAPVDDRWVPIARLRLAYCERKTQESRARSRSRRTPPHMR